MANNVVNLAATSVRQYGKNTFRPKPFEHIWTCNTGDLIPGFCTLQINPGSTWKITTSILARLNTSKYPTIARGWVEYMWTYTPHFQVWDHWNELMGENTESAWVSQTTYSVPKIFISENIKNGSLLDHFGWPNDLNQVEVSALKLRHYNWVCDQIARDQNIEAPFAPSTDDSDIVYRANGDHTTGGKPYQINRKADYFSTALPEPYKGPDVLLPLGSTAPITGKGVLMGNTVKFGNGANANSKSPSFIIAASGNIPGESSIQIATGGSSGEGTNIFNEGIYNTNTIQKLAPSQIYVDPTGLTTDLSQAQSPNLFAVREAFTTLHIYERDARSGTRAPEMLYARWGVEVDTLELGRPRILSMGRFPITFEQIPQTSETTETSEQGTLTAFGYTNNRSDEETFSFKYHGCLMCLVAIRFEHKYQYGIPAEDMKFDRFDWWHPEFAGLGDQPIYNYEIYANPTTIATKSIFGYAERGSEYKNYPSIITGQVRSTYSQSMDYVHMADKYISMPTLSPKWMKENPDNVDRTIFVSSSVTDQWLVDMVVEMEITDTIPLYSIPGIDRL
ncbi:major capsid protein [Dipodfec virus UOA04_Rod_615]|nr:major capsid protein [Dipodfec virus UOA04_Rod_615]